MSFQIIALLVLKNVIRLARLLKTCVVKVIVLYLQGNVIRKIEFIR